MAEGCVEVMVLYGFVDFEKPYLIDLGWFRFAIDYWRMDRAIGKSCSQSALDGIKLG